MSPRRALGALLLCLGACGGARPGPAAPAVVPPPVELVESWPLGTSLDHADVVDAADLWPRMFDAAARTIDLAEFYLSNGPEPGAPFRGKLEPALTALERAATRGVRVRLLVDETFHVKYPETVARLAAKGVTVRRWDVAKATGGVLHAKYFVVDGRDAYLGSQNFDWRSLAHIHELGVRARDPAVVAGLAAIFASDWARAGGQVPGASAPIPASGASLRLAASPASMLPPGVPWDLPELTAAIGRARHRIRVQLLTYKTKSRDGTPFPTLDDALRAAAARGVHVELMVSHWGEKDESLRALAAVPGISVSIVTIPKGDFGDIPFARVAHAKYMVVDDVECWVGTSNWEGDYFTKSRNVGVFYTEDAFATRLGKVFEDVKSSGYTRALTPSRE
jgi:phosphatidylserine/phosphatidylglycerophosphate/cardiolipin synthase-like enzyme